MTPASDRLPNQFTVRLDDSLAAALQTKAKQAGQEPIDFATDVIARAVHDAMDDQAAARRLDAKLKLKARVVALARRLSPPEAFDTDVTLKVFRTIRANAELLELYTAAVGGDINIRGQNTAKAQTNREIGSLTRSALWARVETVDGAHPVKVSVSNELMFSYTRLLPGSSELSS